MSRKTMVTMAVASFLAVLATPLQPAQAMSADSTIVELDSLSEMLNVHDKYLFVEAVHCGADGECNYTECPEVDCGPGDSKQCTCDPTGGHCGWPWDRKMTFACTCECSPGGSEPPEPDPPACLVGNPTSSACLIYKP